MRFADMTLFTVRSVSIAMLALAVAASAFALTARAPVARAIDTANPDWPCIARKVPELDAAAIWDGPSIDDAKGWNKDDTIRKLSAYLISRRVPLAEAEAAIKKYAGEQAEDARDAKLTELFAAVLSRTNDERKIVMSGIERFHKRQLARAAEIEKMGLALPKGEEAALPTEPTPSGEIDKLSDAEEKYKWEVRVFQERQQNIPIACEIPQLMDERAGAVARAIRAEMKN